MCIPPRNRTRTADPVLQRTDKTVPSLDAFLRLDQSNQLKSSLEWLANNAEMLEKAISSQVVPTEFIRHASSKPQLVQENQVKNQVPCVSLKLLDSGFFVDSLPTLQDKPCSPGPLMSQDNCNGHWFGSNLYGSHDSSYTAVNPEEPYTPGHPCTASSFFKPQIITPQNVMDVDTFFMVKQDDEESIGPDDSASMVLARQTIKIKGARVTKRQSSDASSLRHLSSAVDQLKKENAALTKMLEELVAARK